MNNKVSQFYRIEKHCIRCGFCLDICSWDALDAPGKGRAFTIEEDLCPGCGICVDCCPVGAIQKVGAGEDDAAADR
ncbi:4Fe-4S binding protein [Heliomicrobium modesticaldum]|nr:4Fe-4S binding protein [Heliomicrobium modesticaldum]